MKKLKLLKVLAVTAMVGGCASLSANAQLVTLAYPGDGDPGSGAPFEPTLTHSSTVSGSYGFGSGLELSTNGFYHGYLASSTDASTAYAYPATLADAESDGTYYGVTVAPISGNKLSLSSFDLSNTAFFSGPSDGTFVLESSLTGDAALGTFAVGSTGTKISLGAAFQKVKGPITFELYVYGVSNTYEEVGLQGPPANVNTGSLAIDGTSTPIPEPASFALMGVGLASVALLGRVRRSSRKL